MSVYTEEDRLTSSLDFMNSNTKMDLSVDGYKEIAGPLGGLTVEYLLNVHTSLPAFKTSFQSDSAVVTFSVSKTYREFEYFYKKLKAKFPKLDLPDVSTHNPLFVEDKDARQRLVDALMKFVAGELSLASSDLLINFLGYDPNRTVKVPATSAAEPTTNLQTNVEDMFEKTGVKRTPASWGSRNTASENIFTNESEDDEDEDIFHEFNHHVRNVSTSLFSEVSPLKEQRGGHLLFQQQDLGGALDKRDEPFYVPSDAKVNADNKSGVLMKHVEDTTELLKIDDSLSDIFGELQQQTGKLNRSKPALPPKPHVSPTPSTCSKPTPSPRPQKLSSSSSRPVPPPRTTMASKPDIPAPGTNTVETDPATGHSQVTKPQTDTEIASFDILSYIKSEENVCNENLDLF